MSEYESAEQQQIRRLRNDLSAMTSQAVRQTEENNLLRQQLENVRRQQSVENERLVQHIQSQVKIIEEQQVSLKQQNQAIQSLDKEIKEKERLQNEKIRNIQTQYSQQIQSMNTRFQEEI